MSASITLSWVVLGAGNEMCDKNNYTNSRFVFEVCVRIFLMSTAFVVVALIPVFRGATYTLYCIPTFMCTILYSDWSFSNLRNIQ